MAKVYINETGSELILDTGINVGTVANQYIQWLDPAGEVGTFTATLYSSYSDLAEATGTYFLKHTLISTDLDVSGDWSFQAWVAAVDGTWLGDTVHLNVYGTFE